MMKSLIGKLLYSKPMLYVYQMWPLKMGVKIRNYIYRRLMHCAGDIELYENIIVKGFKNIRLGKNMIMHRNSSLFSQKGKLTIGDECAFGANVQLSASQGEIVIGDNVMVGSNTIIRAANHRYDSLDLPMRQQGHVTGKVVIEDDVWIASSVVISQDVTIGTGAVIGACAFVHEDVPPYAVVGGVPAKVLKMRK